MRGRGRRDAGQCDVVLVFKVDTRRLVDGGAPLRENASAASGRVRLLRHGRSGRRLIGRLEEVGEEVGDARVVDPFLLVALLRLVHPPARARLQLAGQRLDRGGGVRRGSAGRGLAGIVF